MGLCWPEFFCVPVFIPGQVTCHWLPIGFAGIPPQDLLSHPPVCQTVRSTENAMHFLSFMTLLQYRDFIHYCQTDTENHCKKTSQSHMPEGKETVCFTCLTALVELWEKHLELGAIQGLENRNKNQIESKQSRAPCKRVSGVLTPLPKINFSPRCYIYCGWLQQ